MTPLYFVLEDSRLMSTPQSQMAYRTSYTLRMKQLTLPKGSNKPHSEMIEGPEAFEKFRNAMKAILTVPKSALPPSPFKKWKPKKKRVSNGSNPGNKH